MDLVHGQMLKHTIVNQVFINSVMKTFEEFLTEKSHPRIRRIRVRIRNGKVQRNVKKSGVKGYTLRGGHLIRMSTTERMHRKRGARRGKIKRRAKMARALMKRRRSLRKLRSFGAR
jgi:hypothetical protein